MDSKFKEKEKFVFSIDLKHKISKFKKIQRQIKVLINKKKIEWEIEIKTFCNI